jgi:uncharacterized protein YukE
VTPEVYGSAKSRLSNTFETLSQRNSLDVSPALIHELGNVSDEATRFGTTEAGNAVKSAIDEVMSKMDPATGLVPGKAYQTFDSKMSRLMKGGDEKAIYLGRIREAVRDAMDASIAPADKAAWDTARSQYKNLKAVRDIVAKDGADGFISPAALMSRLNSTQAGKESMAAANRGELGDIARIGKQFVQDKIPNSGTAQRLLAQSVLTSGLVGSGYLSGADPQTIAGLALAGMTSGRMANRLLNSPASGRAAVRGTTQTISDLLKAAPGRAAQITGGGTGMTIADLMQR